MARKFDLAALLIYQDGAFGERLDKEFVPMPFEVSYWTRAYPEV